MKNFIKQYAAAVKVVEKKSTITVLTGVLIDANAKTMLMTDMDIAVTLRNVPVKGKGKQVIAAHSLNDALKKTGGKFTMKLTNKELVITSNYTYRLPFLDAAENFPILEYKGDCQLKTSLNITAFDKPAYAMSTEETRYYLNGMYVHPVEGVIKTVATDGHRLCLHDTGVKCGDFAGFIVPSKTVKMASDLFEHFNLEVRGDKIRMTELNVEIVSKTVEGTFPEYDRAMPDVKGRAEVKIDWKKLGKFCTGNKSHGVTLDFKSGVMKPIITYDDTSRVETEIENTGTGNPKITGFNNSYVADLMAELQPDAVGYFEQVYESASCGSAPVVFKSGGDIHVLMPMRV